MESRSETASRHFDVAGASAVTASLMVLVYALTRATQSGWGSISTVSLLAVAALLGVSFLAIERRAESPLVPFEVFRGNTLATANVITTIIASIAFSGFFLLTLYLQQGLHYSAAESGLAFTAIAGTVAVMSNVAQRFVTRFGARRVLVAGLLFMAASEAYLVRLPVHGHYVIDLLPAFLLLGVGMGTSFIAVTIAALAGVPGRDAGIASGLVNTSRQIGGAIGLAAITTIATSTAGGHTLAATTHGYRVAFGTLGVLALVAAVLTTTMRAAHHEEPVAAPADGGLALLEEAA